ncbi:MAG: aminopeptidase P family protein [Saprospiraceae bacterium]|nr:aminopeptidase P family protein [Saprospiraceae bacterium]
MADHWKSREWLSGFNGSSGTLVVTQNHAGLWTDSRYFLQAEAQLKGSEVTLQKQVVPHAPEHINWLCENLPPGSIVGCNGSLFSVSQIRQLAKAFHNAGLELNTQRDPIATIWTDRPPLPMTPVYEHELRYAGKSRAEKLSAIRDQMLKHKVGFHLVSTLDDIAWTLNIRGTDVAYNPVSICYLVVGMSTAHLFIARKKVPDPLRDALLNDGVLLYPYDALSDFLKHSLGEHTVLTDATTTNLRLYNDLPEGRAVHGDTIPRNLKTLKNETEVANLRETMRRDGVALLRLVRWLHATLATRTVSEVEVAEVLESFRAEQKDYVGESFAAIVGYQSNGAIVHYHAESATCAQIHPEGILLLDSGGQYLSGTTDITRTFALSTPTAEQKRHYTLVLKGHIALANAHFPAGTCGVQLDTLARQFLWQENLNFGHGTGHGVGFFLNVHEPPQGFTATPHGVRGTTPFLPGMLTSNEPGFYRTGEYGIRIENLVLCVPALENGFGKFYKFESVSLFPIDTTLIDVSMLTPAETTWLNAYHLEVETALTPLLEPDEVAWLKEQCKAL